MRCTCRAWPDRDHPRRCGENFFFVPCNAALAGSPPQVRGKQSVAVCPQVQIRITPADAGKTDLRVSYGWQKADHPRGCGENAGNIKLISIPDGSPPRMRGKQLSAGSPAQPLWITPADAGKTRSQNEQLQHLQDHPRGCGENLLRVRMYAVPLGSPPRMRGKRTGQQHRWSFRRITPADAGKTAASADKVRRRRDHPRGCGENRYP